MQRFKSFLSEARRNANLPAQARLNALQRLSKWKDANDIHISYTQMKKVGFNPKSKFVDTPLAVYAYPLKSIWNDLQTEGVRNVRFAANTSKFIVVLKERGNGMLDVAKYTKSMLEIDLKKIKSMVGEEAFSTANERMEKYGANKTLPYRYLQTFLYSLMASGAIKKRSSAGWAANISKTMIDLGYSGFSDRTGTGQIHPAEEIQTFFLTPKSYEVVDVIEIKEIDVKDERVRDMADYLKKNAASMTDDEIIEIVTKDISLAKYMGPPRVEVLKAILKGGSQPERWTPKQHRNDDPDYDGKDYVPAESSIYTTSILFNYNKLPEEFLSWALKNKPAGIVSWMKNKKHKPTEDFVKKHIEYDIDLLQFVPTVNKQLANAVIKVYGAEKSISRLSQKMSENDFISLFLPLEIDISKVFSYDEKVAKLLYKKILSKKNPTDDDIMQIGGYINKGNKTPPMDVINGLKAKFPDFDFTLVGGWGFWKR